MPVGGSRDDRANHRVIDEIEATTIGDLLDRFGWDRIDLLKIDIYGAEKKLFENAALWVERVNMIVIELHDRFKTWMQLRVFTGRQVALSMSFIEEKMSSSLWKGR